jgi:hypothetical protein
MLDHNITTISTALGGNAPDGGFAMLSQKHEVVNELDER